MGLFKWLLLGQNDKHLKLNYELFGNLETSLLNDMWPTDLYVTLENAKRFIKTQFPLSAKILQMFFQDKGT